MPISREREREKERMCTHQREDKTGWIHIPQRSYRCFSSRIGRYKSAAKECLIFCFTPKSLMDSEEIRLLRSKQVSVGFISRIEGLWAWLASSENVRLDSWRRLDVGWTETSSCKNTILQDLAVKRGVNSVRYCIEVL